MKQKNIQDQFELESFLKLNEITPMQTSYTQTAEDRKEDPADENADNPTDSSDNDSGIEPLEPKEENDGDGAE